MSTEQEEEESNWERRNLRCEYPGCAFLATNESGATRHFLAKHHQQPILYRQNIVLPPPRPQNNGRASPHPASEGMLCLFNSYSSTGTDHFE